MTNGNPADPTKKPFQPRCVAIDLEINKKDGRLRQIGAMRTDSGKTLIWSGKEPSSGLDRLDALADGAAFVLGHNILRFDLP
jgi:ATP-dependent DNA helicase RecQ